MRDRLFGWLTINQMLFISHLALVLSIICGMSYSRYQSDWETKVQYLADTSASHIAAYNTFFSGSVAGRNYANLLMQSTFDSLKAIPNLKFAEIIGTSDYTNHNVEVRYSIEKSKGWRLDVTQEDAKQLSVKLNRLESALASTPEENSVHIKKLNRLINKVKLDLKVVNENIELQSLSIPAAPHQMQHSSHYLDEEANLLHVRITLRNKNGGHLWAIIDATSLTEIKNKLLADVLKEALIALAISFFLIYIITLWIVSPLKGLATSMKQDIEKIDQSRIPEINRADEIGDLARSYSSLTTRIKNQLRILKSQAETDPLTGIGSRFKYQKYAAEIAQHALQKGNTVYIVICDIDNFKRFNDLYGHTEGDNVLTDVANTMNELIDEQELACRIGGEEFVFILSGKDQTQLQKKIDALRLAVLKLAIPHRGNPPHHVVTVSVGAVPITSTLNTVTVEQAEQLVQKALMKADEQLYSGKESGRNTVMYGEQLNIEGSD
ncbi:diguanylate cyclase domain-containing protein [Vibrio sp. SCSIO 43137]|uniref:diguanylate cyclase domain-containing protein n=1 Tax=Vibrio sp. SCSIO 43137 TaxID=3021011 RepID=UPI002307ED79|nr:diguanylate cyclase [Vibrio sp. SCSIO 43137]WCE32530.1 diguanylate cyclase [Vibrio sp. SCSIO 43137]